MSMTQDLRDIQHFGEEGGVVPVIDHAATSTFLNPDDMEKVFHGEIKGCYLYSRHSNPTVNAFSQKLAAVEGTEAAFGVASGMAAISCTVHQLLMDGGHMVSSNTIYGGTWALFKNILPKQGVKIDFVDPYDVKAFEAAITPDTKVIYTESMSNPLLGVSDIPALAKLAKKHGCKLVVDNTFTPLIFSPKKMGADVVVYSCTKYISGHSDMIAGAICADRAFIDQLIDVNNGMCMLYGPVMDARIAYELYTRLDTLPLRMIAHSKAARILVARMKKEGIEGIIYPGLPEHPQNELFDSLRNEKFGHGGMITFDCGDLKKATRLAQKLQDEKFGLFAVSLGFTRTLLSCPAASTSSEIPEEDQKKIGLKPGLLRMSIGFVGDDDLMAERFIQCYKAVCK
jgi:methionine-gamma-lyase